MAADPREFSGLLACCNGIRKLDMPVHWARYGEAGDRRLWMLANGAGAERAAAAADIGHPACQPDAMVSMGFCGALDPALKIGDVFVADAVEAAGRRFPSSLPASAPPHSAGLLVSIDHVAQTAAEKQALRATGAAAVEMEAGGVAKRAAALGTPMFCIRSVSDLASQTFVTDFNRALRTDGRFGTINILKSALGNPGKAFPELIRLRRFCSIATRTLGEFIAGCRF